MKHPCRRGSANKQEPDPICIQSLLLSRLLRWNYLWKGTAANLKSPGNAKLATGLTSLEVCVHLWVPGCAGFGWQGLTEGGTGVAARSFQPILVSIHKFFLYFLCSPAEEGRDRAALGPARVSPPPNPIIFPVPELQGE